MKQNLTSTSTHPSLHPPTHLFIHSCNHTPTHLSIHPSISPPSVHLLTHSRTSTKSQNCWFSWPAHTCPLSRSVDGCLEVCGESFLQCGEEKRERECFFTSFSRNVKGLLSSTQRSPFLLSSRNQNQDEWVHFITQRSYWKCNRHSALSKALQSEVPQGSAW